MRQAWMKLVDYASTPRFLIGASVFRIVGGAGLLYQYLMSYAQRHYLFGPDGVFPYDEFLKTLSQQRSFSLYALSSSSWLFEALYHVGIVATLVWTLGVGTRWLTPLVWLLWWSMHERFPHLWDGGDNLMQIVLLYLCFANVGCHLTLASKRREMGPVASMLHNSALLAAGIQLCLVYGIAGLAKVQGESWRDGTALYYALRAGEFNWVGYSQYIYESSTLLVLLAYATVAFQVSFTFVFFLSNRLRTVWLAAGILFHLGILVFMGLTTFAVFMMATDLIFVADAHYRWLVPAGRRVLAAVTPRWMRDAVPTTSTASELTHSDARS